MRSPYRFTQAALVAATLLFPGGTSAAPGINLAWNHCLGEGTGVQNAAFACDTNAGSHTLVGSFQLGSDMAIVIGDEVVIQLASASPVLPSWWQYYAAGSCRLASLSASFLPDPPGGVCVDWAQGQAVGGVYYCTSSLACADYPPSPNGARMKVVSAVTQQAAQQLQGGVEYFSFNVTIDHAKTIGDGACEGCSIPVCLVLNSIEVVDRTNHSRKLTTPTAPGSNFVTWQGGGVPIVGGASGCPAATAAHRSTWGDVKTLYR